MSKFLLSGAVALVATLSLALSAQALDRRVNIVNGSSYTIMEFYASSVGVEDWEEDILGPDVLPSGSSVMVNIDDGTGYCKYDLMAVFEDGDEAVKHDVNVCEVATFTFTD